MKLILISVIFLFLTSFVFSKESCGNYLSKDGLSIGICEQAEIDHSNKASLQRGAKLYVNYCFGCHSLKYARYKRVSDDLEIPIDLFKENLLFGEQKMGDLMTIGMQSSEAKEWFGIAPPDLTLESSLRGADWLYTYLISFYLDESRPFGVNNMVFEDVAMPNVLSSLQGDQKTVCKKVLVITPNGGVKQDPLTGEEVTEEKCGFLKVEEGSGELTTDQFKASMQDLTNFLSYMSDPIKEKREYIGKFVILYLLIFTIFSYLLYREFQKDVH